MSGRTTTRAFCHRTDGGHDHWCGDLKANRPRLLDLFCCAGGAGTGYSQAGFQVTGVDINPQPNYPFEFIQADALDFASWEIGLFDAVHASPPCQAYTPLGALHPEKVYPDLVARTRDLLDESGKPYIIENVMAAPLIKERSVTLCGGMFGLRTYRHRRFESNVELTAPAHPKHVARTATSRRRERWDQGWHVSITGDVGTYLGPEAMGIDWMTGNELCEAIPPAYTEHLGRQLYASVLTERAA
jgi:DNA (cytosine-5)-methyltransferase 1